MIWISNEENPESKHCEDSWLLEMRMYPPGAKKYYLHRYRASNCAVELAISRQSLWIEAFEDMAKNFLTLMEQIKGESCENDSE